MFRKTLLLLALGLLLAPVVQAQTVDEILAKHYDAMGGLFNIAHDARLVGERIAAS